MLAGVNSHGFADLLLLTEAIQEILCTHNLLDCRVKRVYVAPLQLPLKLAMTAKLG